MRKIWFALLALGLLGASCHRKCPAYAQQDGTNHGKAVVAAQGSKA